MGVIVVLVLLGMGLSKPFSFDRVDPVDWLVNAILLGVAGLLAFGLWRQATR